MANFPAPDRSGQPVATVKGADGVLDIGWSEGVLSDGRPYRAEMWAQDQVSMLTIFFSMLGLEAAKPAALFAMLEKDGLVQVKQGFAPSYQIMTWSSGGPDAFWSVNVTVGTDDETYLAKSVAVARYVPGGPNTNLRR